MVISHILCAFVTSPQPLSPISAASQLLGDLGGRGDQKLPQRESGDGMTLPFSKRIFRWPLVGPPLVEVG